MNGRNRQIIVTDKNGWPDGIAYDPVSDRVYWIDGVQNTINSCDVNGSHRVMLSMSSSFVDPGYGYRIAVFQEYIYWTSVNFYGIAQQHQQQNTTQNILSDVQTRIYEIAVVSEKDSICK